MPNLGTAAGAALAVLLAGCLMANVPGADARCYGPGTKTRLKLGEPYVHPLHETEYMETFIKIYNGDDDKCAPLEVGVRLTKGFVENAWDLPSVYTPIPLGPGVVFNLTSFDLYMPFDPRRKGWTPYKFAKVDFNTNGHPAPGAYDVPHWDFHFFFPDLEYWHSEYSMANANPTGPNCFGLATPEFFRYATKPVPVQCYPEDYVSLDAIVWGHGRHLGWKDAPEIAGTGPFTHTLIYGQHAGEIVFQEPMITHDLFLAAPEEEVCWEVPTLPAKTTALRYMGTKYCMKSDDTYIYVYMKDFVIVKPGCKVKKDTEFTNYLSQDLIPPPLKELCIVDTPPTP